MGEKIEGPWVKKTPEIEFAGNKWTLRTTIEAIGEADEAFMAKLRENGWDDDEAQELWYGFHEAVANAIGHGNLDIEKPKGGSKTTGELMKEELEKHPEKKNKKVEIVLEVNQKKVRVEIADEGIGFKLEDVPDPTSLRGQHEAKGRGILFMKKFFDSVDYEQVKDKDGNIIGNKAILVREKK